jgi:hypothetical protein
VWERKGENDIMKRGNTENREIVCKRPRDIQTYRQKEKPRKREREKNKVYKKTGKSVWETKCVREVKRE